MIPFFLNIYCKTMISCTLYGYLQLWKYLLNQKWQIVLGDSVLFIPNALYRKHIYCRIEVGMALTGFRDKPLNAEGRISEGIKKEARSPSHFKYEKARWHLWWQMWQKQLKKQKSLDFFLSFLLYCCLFFYTVYIYYIVICPIHWFVMGLIRGNLMLRILPKF